MADSERIGPYRVIQRLGAGGMGEVVLAHDARLDRLVAIKRLHDDTATAERRDRFRREARIAARLDHPAIVRIHDVLHEAGHDYLIMEYVEGQTLRARCAAGPMTVSEVLGIAHQIALGMAAAHDLGIIHRDLKAENVLITRAGRAKLTDFGIAKLESEDTVTARGAVLGTFRAMSPEQALGHPLDHRSDLFSFGILLYEALAGESPFRADTPYLTVQRLVDDEPRPLTELAPSIPADLASLVHQLLAKEPLLRPRDFHEVADALIELTGQACDAPCRAGSSLDGLPRPGEDGRSTEDSIAPPRGLHDTGEPPPASAPPTKAAAPRRRTWRAAALGVVALSALGLGYTLRGGGRSRAPAGASIVRVAVLAPVVSGAGDHPDVALLATSVRNAIIAGVQARVGLDLVPRDDIDSYVEGLRQDHRLHPEQRTIRTAVGADELIATHFDCLASSCKVTLERDAGASGSPLPESFQLAADAAVRPGDTITVHMSRLYPDYPVRDAAAAGALDPQDYDRYVHVVQDYWAGGGTSSDTVLDEIKGIRERSPRSLEVLLFEAEVRRHQYEETEDPHQAQRATALLQEADKLFPATYDILSARFNIALDAGQLDEAGGVLGRLIVLDPDSSVTHLQRAKLHWKRGELKLARVALDAAAQRDSFSWRVLYYQARVSKALHDQVATRTAIDKLLQRSPGNYAGMSLRAREELDAGRLACAEQIYGQLVARKPLYHECANLGYTLYQLGRYREAADGWHCALAIRPGDLSMQLGLADSLLLAGDTIAAGAQLRALHEALARRRHDSPAGALRGADLLVEAQTLAYLGRDDLALARAARARAAELVTLDASSDALSTAALVYAVLGDRDQAATYVTKYLEDGGLAADLGSPWFDDLRRDRVLGPRLAIPSIARSCEVPAP